jgi:hypothetical protein
LRCGRPPQTDIVDPVSETAAIEETITMFGAFLQDFYEAETDYRREQIKHSIGHRTRRPFHLPWPLGGRGNRPHHPSNEPAIRRAPHHATSH